MAMGKQKRGSLGQGSQSLIEEVRYVVRRQGCPRAYVLVA